jgi:hypothetical protein
MESTWLWQAIANCLSLLVHCIRRAASRAAWTAGNSNAINTPIIAITTRSSTNVKPNSEERERVEELVEKSWESQHVVFSFLNSLPNPAPLPLVYQAYPF